MTHSYYSCYRTTAAKCYVDEFIGTHVAIYNFLASLCRGAVEEKLQLLRVNAIVAGEEWVMNDFGA